MAKRLSPLLQMVAAGVFGGLVFLATYFLGIPYAGGAGYLAFGDVFALLSTYLFGPVVGLGSALIGSIFSDLAKGFAAFIPFTVLSKSLMILSAYGVFFLLRKKPKLAFIGFLVGGLMMPLGYLPAYLWLYPDAAWMCFGFDAIQGVACASLAIILHFPLSKAFSVKPKKEE